jgi:hypothetical protein
MTAEEALAITMARWNSVPFSWGDRDDCCMSVFAHCELVTGKDAGAEWRGTYEDEESALRVIDAAGGMLAGLDKGLTGIGLARTDQPRRGDPICAKVAGQEVAGLYLGEWSTFRLYGRGRIDLPVKPAAAWSLV